jgi:MFS family permease
VHGFSTGFTPTGQAAYVSDIIPAERRGEAMGILGTGGTLGMAAGPALGGMLGNNFGVNSVFYCSSAFAFVSIIILSSLRETLREKNRFHPRMMTIGKDELFAPEVLTPCIVMALSAYAFGAVFTVIPDFGAYIGIKNKGLLFTYLLVASLLVRLIGGKASDVYGRKPVLMVSTIMIAASMLVLAFAKTPFYVIIGVSMYGLGQGATSPTLLAWATDLSDIRNKGKGIASLYIFMELGIGIGAFASGFIYANQSGNFPVTFIICSLLALLGFLYLTISRRIFNITSS